MKLLVCNAGSTSLKFKLFVMPGDEVLAEGKVERVGSLDSAIFHFKKPDGFKIFRENLCIPTYTEGIQMFLDCLLNHEYGVLSNLQELERVGFKTVLSKDHYGIHELTPEVLKGMEEYLVVAPAHNIPYLEAIRRFQKLTPDAMLVGAFETAFHTTIPLERKLYGIPYEWYEKYGIERLGYHGASHSYVAETLSELYGSTGKAISCHLGGSGSLCAIDNGKSVDTSFGLSLQVGLIQSNRNGDMDPFIIPFLLEKGMKLEDIMEGLTKKGGLLGISGVSNDLRDIEEAANSGNERAKLAIHVFCNGIVRYIGSYYAELGGLDHLVFTGGIGEHGCTIRHIVCNQLKHMGILLDPEKNLDYSENAVISLPSSPVTIHVIPANEELGVARKTFAYKKN
ncbi:MAG: acetate/propionate family kinase [Lachnospiraceae bacterium]|uniref:acetate/propionate family kinase n=1 Tax=Candidatus Merdisoma sp. JLR.KK006 TaxID=3112626 RepID=UPI002FF227D2|nr:acetate/propionate family kinase [Lachnospiraceae bacterium]